MEETLNSESYCYKGQLKRKLVREKFHGDSFVLTLYIHYIY